MSTTLAGTDAYRIGGTVFGGPNPYGAWSPIIAGGGTVTPGMIGTNRTIGVGYSPYAGYNPYGMGFGGFPSIWGNVGAMGMEPGYMEMRKKMGLGMGISRASEYSPDLNDRAEEEDMKIAAKKVCSAIRRDRWYNLQDFDEDEIAKRWSSFADAVKNGNEYQKMIATKKRELIDKGMDETEADTEAKKYAQKGLFGLMLKKYKEYIKVDLDDDISENNDYWFSEDDKCSELIDQLRSKSS